jgi:mannosyltransferase OCH1-like enzyme
MIDFPKIIHQIWLQGLSNLPIKHKKNVDAIINMNPTWEHRLWGEIEILNFIQVDNELIDAYYKLAYLHQKVDFARYIILNKIGGIYIDIDVEPVKELTPLISEFKDYNLIVSKLNMDKLESYIISGHAENINNAIIIAKPDNIILKKMIDHIIKKPMLNSYFPKFIEINNTTGPAIFTKIIFSEIKNLEQKVKILDPEYLEPKLVDICNITKNTYLIHHQDLTWISSHQRSLFSFYLKYKYYLFLLIIILIIIFILYFK